jgi:GDP-L-fucose synthase
VIDAAYQSGVKKMLMFGSSCIYPRDAPQPFREEYLLSGPLEETNRAYAIAKIAAIELCEAYRRQLETNFAAVIPCNLYGSNDTYDPHRSHVVPALIHKMHLAKEQGEKVVELWGTGKPLREFLHVDDLAEACLLVMDEYDELGPINIGSGEELTIADLACEVAKTVQFEGDFCFSGELDGVPRKLLDSSRIRRLGWEPKISLRKGLAQTYESYLRDHS